MTKAHDHCGKYVPKVSHIGQGYLGEEHQFVGTDLSCGGRGGLDPGAAVLT